MTNWVTNELTITGPKEERERFLKECINDKKEFDFGKLIPEPAEFPKADDPIFPDGYVWHYQHWGTKCNATDTDINVGDDQIILSFSTAGNPPIPVFDELGHCFPKLTLAGKYFESMLGIGGEFVLHEGKCDFTDKSEEVRAEYEKACATSGNHDPGVEEAEVPF